MVSFFINSVNAKLIPEVTIGKKEIKYIEIEDKKEINPLISLLLLISCISFIGIFIIGTIKTKRIIEKSYDYVFKK